MTVLHILDNVVFLSVLGFLVILCRRWGHKFGRYGENVLIGVSFGLIAFLTVTAPVELTDGSIVDGRAGPIIFAGILGGPVGGVIAAVIGATGRLFAGGSYLLAGIVAFPVYAAIGIAARNLKIVTPDRIATAFSIAVLAAASLLGAASLSLLVWPFSMAPTWLVKDFPFVALANVLAIVFAALVVGLAIQFLKRTSEVEELNETLNLAKRAGGFGIWDLDLRTGNLEWDSRSLELHGLKASEFKGTFADWAGAVHPDDLAQAKQHYEQALKSGTFYETEYRVGGPDNVRTTIKGSAIIMRDATGKPQRIIGTNLDLTALRKAEADLDEVRSQALQAQGFEQIGQLTGGIAHDFNNLLAIIMGNQELLKGELEQTPVDLDEANSLIDASLDATRRGADLTRNMLAYARKAKLEPEDSNLNNVVVDTRKWLRRTIESRIEIEVDLQPDLWLTSVDQVSLQNALVNLLVNARDAFDGPGTVTVRTSNILIKTGETERYAPDLQPGRYVMLSVTDDGAGIAPDVEAYIFDPFFTTKPTGKGTGLGLSMVEGFVKQSGGSILVNSELGVGTSFRLYFPAVTAPEDTVVFAEDPLPSSQIKVMPKARVLIVEDQPEVLAVLEKSLRASGFDVLTAASGDAALALFKEDQQFDLILSDIVMPGRLQGPELALEIQQIKPAQKFIFLSGYASAETVQKVGLRAEDVRLMKPVSKRQLLDAVVARLASPS